MSCLPDEAVKEFQEIYKIKCGKEISFEEAKIEAENFIRLFDLITKTPKKEQVIKK